MSKQDDQFIRQFLMVLVTLFVFFLLALFIARGIGAAAVERSKMTPGEVAKRIEPVGSVRFGEGGEMMAAPEPEVQVAAAAPAQGGDSVYTSYCSACHGTGAAGAPKLGDGVAWEPRVTQGMDALVGNAIKGKGLMPAKGGFANLSDEEIANAVKYILDETGVSAN